MVVGCGEVVEVGYGKAVVMGCGVLMDSGVVLGSGKAVEVELGIEKLVVVVDRGVDVVKC